MPRIRVSPSGPFVDIGGGGNFVYDSTLQFVNKDLDIYDNYDQAHEAAEEYGAPSRLSILYTGGDFPGGNAYADPPVVLPNAAIDGHMTIEHRWVPLGGMTNFSAPPDISFGLRIVTPDNFEALNFRKVRFPRQYIDPAGSGFTMPQLAFVTTSTGPNGAIYRYTLPRVPSSGSPQATADMPRFYGGAFTGEDLDSPISPQRALIREQIPAGNAPPAFLFDDNFIFAASSLQVVNGVTLFLGETNAGSGVATAVISDNDPQTMNIKFRHGATAAVASQWDPVAALTGWTGPKMVI